MSNPTSSPRPTGPTGPMPPRMPQAAAGGAPVLDPVKLLKKYKYLVVASVVLGVFVGVAGHFALLRFFPIYTARAIFQVTRAQQDIGEVLEANIGSEKSLERFMATEAQKMNSDSVLASAASDPRLRREAVKWAEHFMSDGRLDPVEAMLDLKDRVKSRPIPKTEFIELSARWHDPVETQVIVRTVRDAYQAALRRQVTSVSNKQRDALQSQITKIEQLIVRKQGNRDALIGTNDIESLDQKISEAGQGSNLVQQQLAELRLLQEAMIVSLQRMEDELSLKDTPAGITFSDLIKAQAEQDPIVAGLKNQITGLEAELQAMRLRGVGTEHMDYIKLTQTVRGYKQHLQEVKEQSMLMVFQSELEGARQMLAQYRAQEADAMDRAQKFKQEMVALHQVEAKVKDLNSEISSLTETKSMYESKLQNLQALAELDTIYRVSTWQDEEKPEKVSFPKLEIMIPVGVVLVVGAIGGVVVLREVLDQRVKGPADVAMIPRTRVLGVIPHMCEDPSHPDAAESAFIDSGRGVIAESFRHMRSPILKKMQQAGHKSLLVIAGQPQSGATTVVTNLAAACASVGQRVLIIDANFRRPALHRVMGVEDNPGLAEVLDDRTPMEQAVIETKVANLSLLPAGSAVNRLPERLSSEAMSKILAQASAAYDLVLVDIAPAIVSGDAMALANRCDASILVCRALSEKRGLIARLRNEIGDSRSDFLGVLVNAVRSASGGYFARNIQATHAYHNDAA